KIAFTVKRTGTVCIELKPQTVGQLVLALTHFNAHPHYRFSRNEIAFKVRLIFAERLGVPLEEITEETNFTEDFGVYGNRPCPAPPSPPSAPSAGSAPSSCSTSASSARRSARTCRCATSSRPRDAANSGRYCAGRGSTRPPCPCRPGTAT